MEPGKRTGAFYAPVVPGRAIQGIRHRAGYVDAGGRTETGHDGYHHHQRQRAR